MAIRSQHGNPGPPPCSDNISTSDLYNSDMNHDIPVSKSGAMCCDDSLDDEPVSVEGITFYSLLGIFSQPLTQSWHRKKDANFCK